MIEEEIHYLIDKFMYFTAILSLCLNFPTPSLQSVSILEHLLSMYLAAFCFMSSCPPSCLFPTVLPSFTNSSTHGIGLMHSIVFNLYCNSLVLFNFMLKGLLRYVTFGDKTFASRRVLLHEDITQLDQKNSALGINVV